MNTASDGGIQRTQPFHRRITGPARRSTKGQWTEAEDEVLRKAVQCFNGKNWKKIAECFKDRTDVQCLHRWQKVLNPDLVKGPWSKEEDDLIISLVKKYGAKKWSTIARYMPGRIGKQCRERWHNHLNPIINKEAWTQEEELILIRAHKMYGNKWAELMKFLPGRSDNSIKNHWNSAVKKKLDTYLASGLLADISGLPKANHAGQLFPSSSSTAQQSSGDDSVTKDGKEVSECSQNLSENLYTRFEEIEAFPEQEIAETSIPSNFIDQDYSPVGDNSDIKDWEINPNDLPDISQLDFGEDFSLYSASVNENNGLISFPQQISMEKTENMVSVNDHYRNVYANMDMDGLPFPDNFTDCQNITDISGPSTSLLNQPSHYQISYFCSGAGFINDSNQFNGISYGSQEDEISKIPCNDFSYRNDYIENILESSQSNTSPLHEQVDAKDSPKLTPIDVLSPIPSSGNSVIDSLKNENLTVPSEENDLGSLYYEPLRFPTIDIPFFNCDLIQDDGDVRQEYSPFGIRRLMMSSVNLSPIRLWDSPRRDTSPCAVLKSGTKTFKCTPTILRKRNRDLISPISEKRNEKRPGTQMNQELFSNLARDFSRLDVMFSENKSEKETKPSLLSHADDKENRNYSIEMGKEECKDGNVDTTVTDDNIDETKFKSPKPLRILVEQNMNEMFIGNISTGKQCSNGVSLVISPMTRKKKDAMAGSFRKDLSVENFIYGDNTPFKRSYESPSAWKSPWFFNSFIPGPRVDTDITIEDIGYLMSPGNRSIDAVEMMNHLSEQSADAFAGAQQVLGDETPQTILKERRLNIISPTTTSATNFVLPSTVMTEKRMLDFSDCGTPAKEKASSTSMTFSNSPSRLSKSFR